MKGWIGVDFDGTLAVWIANGSVLGPPIPYMVARVKMWLAKGYDVRIFTSRVSIKDKEKLADNTAALEAWSEEHIGKVLPCTCVKDFNCVAYYDDKAIRVIKNTGMTEQEYRTRKKKRRV